MVDLSIATLNYQRVNVGKYLSTMFRNWAMWESIGQYQKIEICNVRPPSYPVTLWEETERF